MYADSSIYKNLPIEDIEILSKDHFHIKYNNEIINFELKNFDDIKNNKFKYFYLDKKFIQYNYFINNYLCSYLLFTYKDDFKVIDNIALENYFYNLPPYKSEIINNILDCYYDLNYEYFPNLMNNFKTKGFYFQNNHFLDSNFIIHINDNENLIKLLNDQNSNLSSIKSDYSWLKYAFYLSDILMIFMIFFLYRYKFFKINNLFLLISFFTFFLLIMTNPNTDHLIYSYLMYYASVYLFFVSFIVLLLSYKKTNL